MGQQQESWALAGLNQGSFCKDHSEASGLKKIISCLCLALLSKELNFILHFSCPLRQSSFLG